MGITMKPKSRYKNIKNKLISTSDGTCWDCGKVIKEPLGTYNKTNVRHGYTLFDDFYIKLKGDFVVATYKIEAHHIFPHSQGGKMEAKDNLVLFCKHCHRSAHMLLKEDKGAYYFKMGMIKELNTRRRRKRTI